ncbi:SLC13 family permease, partial [Hydrogenophaga aromaticivorans]
MVCLALTPVVARLCLQRGLNPLPFLIGLACAANIGSAATLIGHPQN